MFSTVGLALISHGSHMALTGFSVGTAAPVPNNDHQLQQLASSAAFKSAFRSGLLGRRNSRTAAYRRNRLPDYSLGLYGGRLRCKNSANCNAVCSQQQCTKRHSNAPTLEGTLSSAMCCCCLFHQQMQPDASFLCPSAPSSFAATRAHHLCSDWWPTHHHCSCGIIQVSDNYVYLSGSLS